MDCSSPRDNTVWQYAVRRSYVSEGPLTRSSGSVANTQAAQLMNCEHDQQIGDNRARMGTPRLLAGAAQCAGQLCICSACETPVMRLSRCTTARVQRRSLAHQHERRSVAFIVASHRHSLQ